MCAGGLTNAACPRMQYAERCGCLHCRIILVSNHLPIKAKRSKDDRSWDFEWDDDALIAQAHVRDKCSVLSSCMQQTHEQKTCFLVCF